MFNVSIIQLLDELYKGNGYNPNLWTQIEKNLSINQEYISLTSYIRNSLLQHPKMDLGLDILDYFVDKNCYHVISIISSTEYLNSFIPLLKVNINNPIDTQKKILFLVQKWAFKFEATAYTPSAFPNFMNFYNYLRKQGICFPPKEDTTLITTYQKYLANKQIIINNNQFTASNQSTITNSNKNNNLPGERNDLLKIANLWILKLINVNKLIEVGLNGQAMFNGTLSTETNSIKQNKYKINECIIKYKADYRVRRVFINIKLDIDLTLYRYHQLINKENIDKFYSTFQGDMTTEDFYKNFTGIVSFEIYNDVNYTSDNFGIKSNLKKVSNTIKYPFLKAFTSIKETLTEKSDNNNNNQQETYEVLSTPPPPEQKEKTGIINSFTGNLFKGMNTIKGWFN